MPTIKREVRMHLTELIDWIWKNKIKYKKFVSEYVNSIVYVSKTGKISTGYSVGKTDTFIVETEETITEDTKLLLIERFIGGLGSVNYTSHGEVTINDVLKRNSDDIYSTHFYIENDEREPILIWRDGKLVE